MEVLITTMADETFKLPDSSYDDLRKIIQAYGRFDRPQSLEEITKLSGVHRSTVSGNNGFLVSVGLVEGGRAKSPTLLGKKLARALEHDHAEEVQATWREVVAGNEFLSNMVAAVRIRNGMDAPTLQGHIAYSAGEPKTGRTATGSNTIIQILLTAGLIEDRDGRFVSTDAARKPPEPQQPPSREQEPPSFGTIPVPPREGGPPATGVQRQKTTPSGQQSISVHIEIRIDAKPSELDGLGAKLRRLLAEVSRPEASDSETALEGETKRDRETA